MSFKSSLSAARKMSNKAEIFLAAERDGLALQCTKISDSLNCSNQGTQRHSNFNGRLEPTLGQTSIKISIASGVIVPGLQKVKRDS